MYAPASNINWKNTQAHLVRSAEAELALSQKKKQPLGNKNINSKSITDNKTKKLTTKTAPLPSLKNSKIKNFITYHFYLDIADSQTKNRLEKQIKLLGATIESFFSNKCTHLITSKSDSANNTNKVTEQENIPPSSTLADSNSNKTNQSIKRKGQVVEDTVDKAKRWNIEVWRLNDAIHTINSFLNTSQNKRKQPEKKILGKVYQEDKRFGPSTSANDHTQRPHFVEFTGHYLIVNDVTKEHRPPIIRQYTKDVLDKKAGDFPWPYLKKIPGCKSPFSKPLPPPPQKQDDIAKKEETEKKEQLEKKQEEEKDERNVIQQQTVKAKEVVEEEDEEEEKESDVVHIFAPVGGTADNENAAAIAKSITDASPAAAITTPARSVVSEAPIPASPNTPLGDSQLRASGFQPSVSNTPSTSRCTSGLIDKQSRGITADSNNMNKRVLENLSKKEAYLSQQQQQTRLQKQKQQQINNKLELNKQQQQYKHQNNDMLYCENCNRRFNNLEEHLKSESHLAFTRDQNNYKKLDLLLENTRRKYKAPLPEHLRRYTDISIDGANVKFQTNHKRNRSDMVDMTDIQAPHNKMLKPDGLPTQPVVVEDKSKGWDQYYDVFL